MKRAFNGNGLHERYAMTMRSFNLGSLPPLEGPGLHGT